MIPINKCCEARSFHDIGIMHDGRQNIFQQRHYMLFTTLCNFLRCWAKQLQYQAVVHPDIFLSMVHLQKLASHWRDAEFLLHLRKYRHCCVSFAVERDKLLVIFISELEALDSSTSVALIKAGTCTLPRFNGTCHNYRGRVKFLF